MYRMKTLVTGAGGFVGGYLVEELLNRGERVRAFVRQRSDGSISKKLQTLKSHPHLDIFQGDVTNFYDVLKSMEAVNRVYHLASQSFVPDSVENPTYSLQTNVLGTTNILEAARHCKAYFTTNPRVLFASSSEVYGVQNKDELPLDERSDVRPASPYATSKLSGENLCRNYWENHGIETIITRAFNHEGAGRGHHFVTASIVRQMVQIKHGERDTLVLGNMDVERDWSHVKDIINGYITVMEKGQFGQTYVLGSGISRSIRDFIDYVEFALGPVRYDIRIDSSLLRPTDVPFLRANPSKSWGLGRWGPKFSFGDIIKEMIQYYEAMTPQERGCIL